MKRASVRDLRYDFTKLEAILRKGEAIEITKRRKVIARLTPHTEQPKAPVEMPDFMGRMRKIFGDRMMETTGAELVAWDRDRY